MLIHGHRRRNASPTRTYKSWQDMRARCENKNNLSYHNYGGRGVSVCKRWSSFVFFLQDMGECPSGYMIERKNNERGYSPSNCCWATRKEQNRNRACLLLTVEGVTKNKEDWRRELGISRTTLKRRLKNKKVVLTKAYLSARTYNKRNLYDHYS